MSIVVLGFPMDLGAGRRGVDMGPSAMRIAGLRERLEALGYEVQDWGDLPIQVAEVQAIEDPRARYLPEIARATEELAYRVHTVLESGKMPLVLGGDHSMSIGSIAGIARYCQEHQKTFGVIWIDAHPDMNTPETTPSGNIHGMPLAVSLGYGAAQLTQLLDFSPKVDPANVVLVGIRSIDPGEKELIRTLRIRTYTMYEIDRDGIFKVATDAIDYLINRVDFLHISFDLDSVDPSVAPGVGTPVPGGLSYREAHFLMERLAETRKVHSLEVVEVNPILDVHNQSAEFAVGAVASCLGARIL